MKECFKCEVLKPVDSFYRHKQMKDGRFNKCKECTKLDVGRNYRKNINHYIEYEKGRAMSPHRVLAREEYSKTEAGKDSIRRSRKRWVKRNPIKKSATTELNNKVRDGQIIKPEECSACYCKPKRIHGHHDDYAKPLEVRWLCPSCHKKWHRENGEGRNA